MKMIDKMIDKRVQEAIKSMKDINFQTDNVGTLGAMFGSTHGSLDEMGQSLQQNFKKYIVKYGNEPWVYACAYAISTDLAGLPIVIFKNVKENGKVVEQIVETHDMHELLKQPDESQNGIEFREAVVLNLELTGNNYIKLANAMGDPGAMRVLNSSRMQVKLGKEDERFIAGYIYQSNKKQFAFIPEEIIRTIYYDPNNDKYGIGSVAASRMSILSNQKMTDSNAAWFNQGSSAGDMYEVDKTLPDKVYRRLKMWLKENMTGNKNAHAPGILEAGLKRVERKTSNKDMEFIKGQAMNREAILASFGVPPIRVGLLEHANYSNAKEQMRTYWLNTLIPKLRKIRPIYQDILARYGDKSLDVRFDLSKVEALRVDEKERVDIAKLYFSMGVPIDDILSLLGIPLESRPHYKTGYLPLNLFPVDEKPKDPEPPAEPPKNNKPKDDILDLPSRAELEKKKATDERNKIIIDKFVIATEKLQPRYVKTMKEYFADQEKEVLRNLRNQKDIIMIEDIAGEKEYFKVTSRHKKGHVLKKEKIAFDDIMFNEKNAEKEYQKVTTPQLRNALKTQAEAEVLANGFDIVFDVDNPNVEKYLREFALDNAKGVTGTTKDKLKKTLVEGLREGEPIPDLAKRIRLVYREADIMRSVKIARTEVMSASNHGAFDAYKQTDGLVVGWKWLTAGDDRVDEVECAPLEGKTFKMDEADLLPPIHPNCRCTIIPVLKK